MRREFHVRFCEGLGVRFPRATRLGPAWAADGPRQLYSAAAVGPDGDLYVVEWHAGVIERWDLGTLERISVVADALPPTPGSLTLGPDGLLYLGSSDGIYRFTTDGEALGRFGASATIEQPGELLWLSQRVPASGFEGL